MYSSQWQSGFPDQNYQSATTLPRASAFKYQSPTAQWSTTTWPQQPAPPRVPSPPPAVQWVVPTRQDNSEQVLETLLKLLPGIVRSIVAELQPPPPREASLTRPPTAQTIVYETRWQQTPEEGTVVASVQAVGSSPQPMPRATSASSTSDDPELRITLPATASHGDVLVTPLTMKEGGTPWPAGSTPPKSPVRKQRPCSNCGHVSDPK